MADPTHLVVHDAERYRFICVQDGLTAELNYRTSGSQMVITHIGVPRALEGHGIGSALARAGLEYAREQGMAVVPICWFARSYIERNPQYQSLVSK